MKFGLDLYIAMADPGGFVGILEIGCGCGLLKSGSASVLHGNLQTLVGLLLLHTIFKIIAKRPGGDEI